MSDCPVDTVSGATDLPAKWIREVQSGSPAIGIEIARSAEVGDQARFDAAMQKFNGLNALSKNDAACIALRTNTQDLTEISGLPRLVLITSTRAGAATEVKEIKVEKPNWQRDIHESRRTHPK